MRFERTHAAQVVRHDICLMASLIKRWVIEEVTGADKFASSKLETSSYRSRWSIKPTRIALVDCHWH
jgi:hypothetical protein